MTEGVYYRYEDFLQSSGGFTVDGDYEPGPASLRVRVMTFDIVKKTPKGAWISGTPLGKELVLDHWHRKYANPTQEGARKDFIARKRKLIAVQERRIADARLAIATAEKNQMETSGIRQKCGHLKPVYHWEMELLK